jgi:hypothetical protein
MQWWLLRLGGHPSRFDSQSWDLDRVWHRGFPEGTEQRVRG